MRLVTKTTLLYLLVALVVFGIGGVVAYQMIKKVVDKETDYYLVDNYRRIRSSVQEGNPLDPLISGKVIVEALPKGMNYDTMAVFKDTIAMHYFWNRPEPHRMLTKTTRINGQFYRFKIVDVIIEADDVYTGVIKVLAILFAGLSAALLICGYFIGIQLLKPFNKTLASIRDFNVKEELDTTLVNTITKEFKQLDAFVYRMKDKARRDYMALKEFTENASHEMQTPVAVAKGKLELLLESGDLSEKQMLLIQNAHDSVTKLSRISTGLTLLNKIENEEFSSSMQTNVSDVVTKNVRQFEELAELKGIKLEKEIVPDVKQPVDMNLAEILVGNLLKNAVHHNEKNGWINVHLDHSKLVVSNSGKDPKIETDQLFNRFRKGNQSNGSLGLGLAIAKKICDANKWQINYDYKDHQHRLTVNFV